MGEPVEVFLGDLSGNAVDRDVVLASRTPDVRFEREILYGRRVATNFLTGVHGSARGL